MGLLSLYQLSGCNFTIMVVYIVRQDWPGYWGRGLTVKECFKSNKSLKRSKPFQIVAYECESPEDVWVEPEMGDIVYEKSCKRLFDVMV